MTVTVEKSPCATCKKANLCKYAEDMQKAFNEIADIIAKYDATMINLQHTMYCKQNPPPIEIPSFLRSAT